jgi:maltooligosyltrehalose trehalohydrolase
MLHRRYELGAECADDGVSFRVFADKPHEVALHLEGRAPLRLDADDSGLHSVFVPGLRAGARYGFLLDGRGPYPDPASRAQPDGPHGLSQVTRSSYRWRDEAWRGLRIDGQIVYEMHVGTFTPEGTWRAAAEKLGHLRDLGVTLIEMMPVATFPGAFGWGYDGVSLFAPTPQYGEPDDLRAFVDAAHGAGIGVILDVVYNHLGPDGNYLACYSDRYVTDRYDNEWGDALDFESERAPKRRLVVENARYWVDEFHFDGLRLDATQSIHDASPEHVVAELVRACRDCCGREVVMIGENEPQHASILRVSANGGQGLDALWNDDFHHSAIVALRGRNDAYYEDHFGVAQEFVSSAKHGFLFQGQRYAHQDKRRGQPALDIPPQHFVTFIENHDQIANSGRGRRLVETASPSQLRVMTALLLLGPGTPMLFQGQEFGSTRPFLYFADHKPELARQVEKGRLDFLSQFESLASPEMRERLCPPQARETFAKCKLDWGEAERRHEWLALHRDLIRLRQDDDVISGRTRVGLDGSVLGEDAFLLRYFGKGGDDRLLLFNLGRDVRRRSIPDPLVAPPAGRSWTRLWGSEHPDYGGEGLTSIERPDGWVIPGESAWVLAAQ